MSIPSYLTLESDTLDTGLVEAREALELPYLPYHVHCTTVARLRLQLVRVSRLPTHYTDVLLTAPEYLTAWLPRCVRLVCKAVCIDDHAWAHPTLSNSVDRRSRHVRKLERLKVLRRSLRPPANSKFSNGETRVEVQTPRRHRNPSAEQPATTATETFSSLAPAIHSVGILASGAPTLLHGRSLCLEYGNSGSTAVKLFALALLQALSVMSSSMRWSLALFPA